MRVTSIAVAVAFVLSGCATLQSKTQGDEATTPAADEATVEGDLELHHSSPWEWGPGIRVTVPVGLHSGRAVLQPMGSYTRLMYDGGHENRFEAGAQGRYLLAKNPRDRQMWVGAELAYAWLKDDYEVGSESYDGPSATALFGIPLSRTPLNPTLIGGVGVTHYSNTGVNLRLGLSINPFSK